MPIHHICVPQKPSHKIQGSLAMYCLHSVSQPCGKSTVEGENKCRRNGKLFHGSSKLEKGKNWEQTWVAGLVLQNAFNTNHLPAVLHNI